MMDRLLTVDQVAEMLAVSKWYVYDHGVELGLVKVGGCNRYRQEAIEAYLSRQATPTAAPTEMPARAPQRRRKRKLSQSAVELLPIRGES